jgi:oligo-1,6-glucosidase
MKRYLMALPVILTILNSCGPADKKTYKQSEQQTATADTTRKWWKEAVVYQIYPRSFKDSNGDGVGDLRGIISKLDYIKSLGVDVVWLNPIFSSPNADNGYDISDYRGIMTEFGTMEDFDSLLAGMHQRGIRLVLDLVANHCSDQHPWFVQARSSRDNAFRNYFHWWPAEKGKPAARYSFFDVNNDAWKLDPQTNAWYLHYFSVQQPDLNWENQAVRKEIYDIMRFWFDKGVDGFRMDVIPFISKDTTFPVLPEKYNGDFVAYYAAGPHLHEYLQEMNREVLSKYDIMSVAEGAGVNFANALDFVNEDRHELNMLYHFEGMGIGMMPGKFKTVDPKGWDLLEFKQVYTKWDRVFAEKGWGTIYLGNHDQPRMVTRWGNDSKEFRELSSKMLTTFLMTMRATPYYYFGDELGMNNIKFSNIKDYNDIETINRYEYLQKNGGDLNDFMEAQKITGRDNGRTPFQWDDSPNAGFTTGTPWLKVNTNYKTVNAAAEEADPNSPLNYFRKMVQLRKQEPALVYGKYVLVDKNNTSVYSFVRQWDRKRLLIMLNFTGKPASVESGFDLSNSKVLIDNYPDAPDPKKANELRPYEAVVWEM